MQFKKLLIGLLGLALPLSAQSVSLTIDEIIYEGGAATDSSVLSGTVDMIQTETGLLITLTNTSSGIASLTSSHNLLTGVGFNLPDGVSIDFGAAIVAAGSNTIGFTGSDVSGEWGYDNSPLNSGPFQTAPSGIAQSSVNTTITTMEASTTNAFSPTSVLNPEGLAGPEFGLLSGNVDASVAGGLPAIQDSIVINITLAELGILDPNFDLIGWIESQDVVLSFGSPDGTSNVTETPALLLLGLGLIGLVVSRKRKLV